MTTDNTPPLRARPSRFASGGPQPTRRGPSRMAFRLLGLPVLAVMAVYLFNGVRNYVVLPQCDSDRAKQSLAEVLKQLKLEPVRYTPIKTVASSKEEVVCNAVLPLPDGANVVADYTFYWQGNKANMKYTIHRQAAGNTGINPPAAPHSPQPSASG
jgi:hypothetical protein